MDVDALLDESIEVNVGLCPVTCVTSPSNDGVITLNSSIISDVRSDSKVTEDVIANDKRDDDLTKSNDEAMAELEKKATEIQTYVDLKAQLESECVVGGAIWRMK